MGFGWIKDILGLVKDTALLNQRLSSLEAEGSATQKRLDDHMTNYHVQVESKYLKYKNNILWNTKEDPPQACCPSCHDVKHVLSRLVVEEWDPGARRYSCHSCNYCQILKDSQRW